MKHLRNAPKKAKVKKKIGGEKHLFPENKNCLSCPEITFPGGGGVGCPRTDNPTARQSDQCSRHSPSVAVRYLFGFDELCEGCLGVPRLTNRRPDARLELVHALERERQLVHLQRITVD